MATGLSRDAFRETVEAYRDLHDDKKTSADVRKAQYTTLVNQYYDLATDFYEFGWGQSFHFAPRHHGESFRASLERHERFLARKLRLAPGMKALDVGCGVGGPMRFIANHSGAKIMGVNNNAYQIERGEIHTRRAGLSHLASFLKADFMELPLDDASFDGVYTIEASCHAPDKVALFRELLRVMKPGALFAGYEWCLTEQYDPKDVDHQRIKKEIEEGDGLPDIAYTWEVDTALKEAGFELIEAYDLAPTSDPQTPWYRSLTGKDLSLTSIPRTPIGRVITNNALKLMERVGIAPKGSTKVSDFLNAAADALIAGGEKQIFTPMYFFLARKPQE